MSTFTVFPVIDNSNFSFDIVPIASSAILSTSIFFLPNTTVNVSVVFPSVVVHPSFKSTFTVSVFPTKSPAVVPNSFFRAFNASIVSSFIGSSKFTFTPFIVTVLITFSFRTFSAAAFSPNPFKSSSSSIVISIMSTFTVFPVIDNSNFSFDIVPIVSSAI